MFGQLAVREGGNHAVHEAEELDTAPSLGMLGNDPAAGDFERIVHLGRRVAGALQTRSWYRAACKRGSGRSRRVRSGASSSLAPAPTPGSKASHRRREQSPWQAGRYRDRPRWPLSPRTQGHCSRTRTCGQPDRCCARAESANILNVNILQRHRQQRTRPAGVARRRRLIQKRQNASVRRLTVDWLLACPRAIIQSSKPMIGKAMPPFADNARLNAYFLGDRTCAAAFGRQRHYLRPLQVALRRARGPAARLKHFAYLRPEPNFSCFGNHPDLKS